MFVIFQRVKVAWSFKVARQLCKWKSQEMHCLWSVSNSNLIKSVTDVSIRPQLCSWEQVPRWLQSLQWIASLVKFLWYGKLRLTRSQEQERPLKRTTQLIQALYSKLLARRNLILASFYQINFITVIFLNLLNQSSDPITSTTSLIMPIYTHLIC